MGAYPQANYYPPQEEDDEAQDAGATGQADDDMEGEDADSDDGADAAEGV